MSRCEACGGPCPRRICPRYAPGERVPCRASDVNLALAKEGLRLAKDGEAGWVVRLATSAGIVRVWATDAPPAVLTACDCCGRNLAEDGQTICPGCRAPRERDEEGDRYAATFLGPTR